MKALQTEPERRQPDASALCRELLALKITVAKTTSSPFDTEQSLSTESRPQRWSRSASPQAPSEKDLDDFLSRHSPNTFWIANIVLSLLFTGLVALGYYLWKHPLLLADLRGDRHLEIDPDLLVFHDRQEASLDETKREQQRRQGRRPPLVKAAIDCNIAAAKELLTGGEQIDCADPNGDTALAWAVKRNCPEIVRLLIDRGANVNLEAANGISPLEWARMYGRKELANVLTAAGARDH